MDLQSLVKKIKQKPELRGISDDFVMSVLVPRVKGLHTLSKADERIICTEVRAQLRLSAGRFQLSLKRKDASPEKLVSSHRSTKEREHQYEVLKALVAEAHPSSILDVGCGLNPLVLAQPGIRYYACDINEGEIGLVKDYFRKNAIQGNAFVADMRAYTQFPHVDLCLLLKVLDSIDIKGHPHAERLFHVIKAAQFIVSFPTRKLSGRRMNSPRRRWFEYMIKRLGYVYIVNETDNEIFYSVKKN